MKNQDVIPVLIFSTAYFPFVGGAEVAVQEISSRLPLYSWDLITARLSRSVPRVETVGAVTVYRVGIGVPFVDKLLLPFTGFLQAVLLHRKRKYRIAWSMMASQASIAGAFFKYVYPRVRLVLTIQEGDEEEYLARYVGGSKTLYRIFIRPWHRLVFRMADSITAISAYLKERALKSGATVDVEIIPNGVDLERFTKISLEKNPAQTVLVTTSRLVEKNGVRFVIEALRYLPPSVHFWILGTGPLEEGLRVLAEEVGVSDRVLFLGHKNHEEVASILSRADIFIRPSLSEGLGNSFLEAMALGLPIIGTPVGGIPDFLIDGKTGFFAEPGNSRSIADVVTKVMTSPDLLRTVAENGERLVRERYGWNGVASSMQKNAFRNGETSPALLIAASIYPPDPGGPALHAGRQFEMFRKQGVPTRLVALAHLRVFPFGVRHLAFFFLVFARTKRNGVVFAHDALGAGIPAFFAARLRRARFIVRVGGDIVWERSAESGKTRLSMSQFYKGGFHRDSLSFFATWFVFRFADAVIVPSELLQHLYTSSYGVPAQKIFMIPNPVPRRNEAPNESDGSLLYASRLVAYKNLDRAIAAFEKVARDLPDVRFDIMGDGPERASLQAQIDARSYGKSVRLLGSIPEGQVATRTAECGACIAPALTEFNPNFILRCIAEQKPFLISRENGLPFEVPEQFLIDPEDTEDMARKMHGVLSKEGRARADVALRSIVFEMDWDKVIGAQRAVIQKVCGY